MLLKSKRLIAATAVAGALSAGAGVPALMATPASAQPVVTGGLVNVTVANLLNNNTVQVAVPVTAAADICNVQVAVITSLVSNGGTCTSRSGDQSLTF